MKQQVPVVQFALTIVRNSKNQFLSVLECGNQGWWVPGGGVDPGETCHQAALRECVEEAGINIVLKGVLRIENNFTGHYMRHKVIYYAEPVDEKQPPKSQPDHQSIRAEWLTLEQIKALERDWRGPELYEWALYLSKGGTIYPMDVFEE